MNLYQISDSKIKLTMNDIVLLELDFISIKCNCVTLTLILFILYWPFVHLHEIQSIFLNSVFSIIFLNKIRKNSVI